MDHDQVRRLRAEGQTLVKIGQHFGVSRQRISQILTNVKRRPRPRTPPPMTPRACDHCGREFIVTSVPRSTERRYCSKLCSNRHFRQRAKEAAAGE